MGILETLFEFFGKRIAEHGQYGPVEYLVYGLIMFGLAFFVIYPALDKKGVKFNFKFMISLLPYILLGAGIRVLEDMGFLPRSFSPLELGYWVITPGIYMSIAVVTIACFFIARMLSQNRQWDFYKVFAGIGLLLAAPIAIFEIMNFLAWGGVILVIALIAVILGAVVLLLNKFTKSSLMKSNLNVLVLASQLLDGNATFVSIQFFRCGEQHPISEFFLNLFPFSFVMVKIALVLLILYYVDKEIENENLRGFVKIVVIILGFATGLRDLLTLGVGTCL
ncbi:MAG: DUF63 family protein [archaeon]|jgi:uncharacterized membrane protein|nr:DUF63 family protein [archaeon]